MAVRRAVTCFAMVFLVAILGPQPGVAGQTIQPTSGSCPEMTDSVIRLYQGFFLRAPSSEMFKNLSGQYKSGAADLAQLGDELASSAEFESRYGDVSNERFVTLAFRNVLQQDPSDSERTSWAATLATGYSRGAFMLALTESESFVARTGTTAPLAGFLRWYPTGTHWYCGDGPVSGLTTAPLTGESLHADYMFRNNGLEDTPFALKTIDRGTSGVTVAEGSLPGSMTTYRWDGIFSGDGSYGQGIDVTAAEGVSWIVVFYPESIGENRLGWQLAG